MITCCYIDFFVYILQTFMYLILASQTFSLAIKAKMNVERDFLYCEMFCFII